MVVLSIFIQQMQFFCFEAELFRQSYFGLLFTGKEPTHTRARARAHTHTYPPPTHTPLSFWHNVYFNIYADLAHDVTYTECLTQNGSACGPVFALFKRRSFFLFLVTI